MQHHVGNRQNGRPPKESAGAVSLDPRLLVEVLAAASRGIKNTRDNMDKVEVMQRETEVRLGQLVADLGNA